MALIILGGGEAGRREGRGALEKRRQKAKGSEGWNENRVWAELCYQLVFEFGPLNKQNDQLL